MVTLDTQSTTLPESSVAKFEEIKNVMSSAKKMKKLRKTGSTVVRSSLEFVFSVLIGGGSYTKTSAIFINYNLDPIRKHFL